jgi:hypothetical protein
MSPHLHISIFAFQLLKISLMNMDLMFWLQSFFLIQRLIVVSYRYTVTNIVTRINLMTNLTLLRQLTDDERLTAYDQARTNVVRASGERPQRANFSNSQSKFPAWFSSIVAALMVIAFIASAMPSLFRLFTAGRDYFQHGIDSGWQGAVVGVSTFILAEFLIILSTITARVYFDAKQARIFIIPILMGLSVAFVGNWTVTQPNDLFGWLETIIPPSAVLFLALIGERLILDAIETRHANELAYQSALSEYQALADNPEQSPRWIGTYANALRDAIRTANGRGRGREERLALMDALSLDDWRVLVGRELQASDWFALPPEPSQIEIEQPNPTKAELPNRSGQLPLFVNLNQDLD